MVPPATKAAYRSLAAGRRRRAVGRNVPRATAAVHCARATELHCQLSNGQRPTANGQRREQNGQLFRNSPPPPVFRHFSFLPSLLIPPEWLRKRCGKSIAFS